VKGLDEVLCGASRPGHFAGVATVVAKLLNIFRPDAAFFGAKDFQQTVVIRRMVADLDMPVRIVVCPTVREADGLAMSSRNTYLNPEERRAAAVLFRALSAAKTAFEKGERNAESLRGMMAAAINAEPLARLQYVSCADFDTLEELQAVQGKALLSMAVYVGKTRLIDNFVIE
jgi:pantoate--beta-alanine ligase